LKNTHTVKKTKTEQMKKFRIFVLWVAAITATQALGRFWYVLPRPMTNKKKALAYYREFQKTPCFKESMEAHVYLGELLVEKRQARREGRALLQVAARSDTKFYADMAKRLLK